MIAITETEVKVFDSVKEAADFYGLKSPNLINLIISNALHSDKRTTFDYLYE